MNEDKNIIDARIGELKTQMAFLEGLQRAQQVMGSGLDYVAEMKQRTTERMQELNTERLRSSDSIMQAIILSHKAICKAKNMGEKEAYGQDPAMYYTLGICGEAGELANNVVKALRNGWDKERILEAVKGELPDVVIYSFLLAFMLDLDLTKLVNDKVEVIIKRAESGYYGGTIER